MANQHFLNFRPFIQAYDSDAPFRYITYVNVSAPVTMINGEPYLMVRQVGKLFFILLGVVFRVREVR